MPLKTQLNRQVILSIQKLLKKAVRHSVTQVRELLFSVIDKFTQQLIALQQELQQVEIDQPVI